MNRRTRMKWKAVRGRLRPPVLAALRDEDGALKALLIGRDDLPEARARWGDNLIVLTKEAKSCREP